MSSEYKKVVIIGGNGFIGTNLVSSLSGGDYFVNVLVRKRERSKHLWLLPRTDVIEYENTVSSLKTKLVDTDIIINLVGVLQSSLGEPWGEEFDDAHVQLTKNIVGAAKSTGCNKIIHISALGSGHNAPSMYLRSKAAGEKILHDSEFNVTILRPSVVFGSGDKFLTMFAKMHRFLPLIPLASYNSLFQPIYVGDLVKIIQLCMNQNTNENKIYDCVGPEVFSLGELVELAGILSRRKKLVVPLPDFIARFQAFIMEKIPGPTLLSRDNLNSASIPNISQNSENIFPLKNPTDIKSIAASYLNT